MARLLSLRYTFDHLAALIAAGGALAVLQTFIIGRHYLIPTVLLAMAVLFGNLARAGYRDQAWAKQVLFWLGFVLAAHVFFALFWSVKYRSLLGAAFEFVFAPLALLLVLAVWRYGRLNRVFG